MKQYYIFLILMLFASSFAYAQGNISCGDKFYDSGGASGQYSINENITTVICPSNPGDVVTVNFVSFDTEDGYDFLYIFDGDDNSTPSLGTFSGTDNPGSFTSSHSSGCLTFEFESDGSIVRDGWEADVTCGPPPSCPPPSNLSASNETSTSADLSWSAGGSESMWNIEYGPSGFTQGSGMTISVSSNPYTLTGLTENTSYDYYIQSDCGGGDVSSWVGPNSFNTLIPPPANDECSDATSVMVNTDDTCNNNASGTIGGATASGEDEAACSGTENDDVFYTFTATSTSHLIELNNVVSGGTTDLYHSVWSGNCGSLVNISCSDDNSSTVTGLTIGNTYYVRVNSYFNNSYTTTFDICIKEPPMPPANDDCADATSVMINTDDTCNNNASGTIGGATASGEDEAACSGTENDDVFYTFTATSTSHNIDLYNVVSGGTTDLYHSVWSGNCGSLVNISCSDSDNSTVTGLTIGDTYYVRVNSWANSTYTTTFDICIKEPPMPPANDDCADAQVITMSSDGSCNLTQGTNEGATASGESPVPTCASFGAGMDIWYKVVVPSPAPDSLYIEVKSDESLTDLAMQVYTGSCGNLTAYECDDDDGDGLLPRVDITDLIAGTEFLIRVFEYGNNQNGTFNICTRNSLVLPITLANFEAVVEERINHILWETSSEVGNKYMIVESSIDGNIWHEVGKVTSAGSEHFGAKYKVVDTDPSIVTYYRLRSVDWDGTSMLSEVISAERRHDVKNWNLMARPNPTSGKVVVNLFGTRAERVNIQLIDLEGRVISNMIEEVHSGNNNIRIDFSDAYKGTYILKVSSATNQEVIKIVKL